MTTRTSYYDVGHTGKKWWKYVFWGMLNITVISAYIVWLNLQRPLPNNLKPFYLKAFKLKLVHAVCDGYTGRKRGLRVWLTSLCFIWSSKRMTPSSSSMDAREDVLTKLMEGKSGWGVETTFGCSNCSKSNSDLLSSRFSQYWCVIGIKT